MSGKAGLPAYIRSLGQMATVHGVLEPALRALAAYHPWFKPLVKDYHFRLPFLFEDMAGLGATASDFRPTASANELAELVAMGLAKDPAAVLGVFYVLEGSTNGGTIIAKNIKTALGFADEQGTRFINPHGPQVRSRWTEWKTTLDALQIPAESQKAVLFAAGETFRLMHNIMNDLAAELPVVEAKPELAAATA